MYSYQHFKSPNQDILSPVLRPPGNILKPPRNVLKMSVFSWSLHERCPLCTLVCRIVLAQSGVLLNFWDPLMRQNLDTRKSFVPWWPILYMFGKELALVIYWYSGRLVQPYSRKISLPNFVPVLDLQFSNLWKLKNSPVMAAILFVYFVIIIVF